MADFVDEDVELPAEKSDARPLTVPYSKGYTAADWNAYRAAHNSARSAIKRQLGFTSVKDARFGAVGDGVTDDWAAFDAAIRSLGNSVTDVGVGVSARKLSVPRGCYYLSKPLEISRPCVIEGDGWGVPNVAGATRLKFASNCHGLVFQAANTASDGYTSAGATVRDLEIVSAGSSTRVVHGVRMFSPFVALESVRVGGFSGNGVDINTGAMPAWQATTAYQVGDVVSNGGNNYSCRSAGTSAGSGGPSGGGSAITDGTVTWKYVNGLLIADSWLVYRCDLQGNTLNGLYTAGGDSNVGVCLATSVLYNGGWGVYDSSFLGNTYEGLHAATNVTGPFKSDNANARNSFVNCYSESDQPASSFVLPTRVDGGLHAAGAVGKWYGQIGGTMQAHNLRTGDSTGPQLGITLGSNQIDGSGYHVGAALFGQTSHDAIYLRYFGAEDGATRTVRFNEGVAWNFNLADAGGAWGSGLALEPHVNSLGARPRWLIPGTPFTHKQRGSSSGVGGDAGAGGGGIFNEGIHIGHNAGEPIGGIWHEGDLSFERSPVAGGVAVRSCLTAGTVGAPHGGQTVTADGSAVVTLSSAAHTIFGPHVGDRLLINGVTDVYITAIEPVSRVSVRCSGNVPAGSGLSLAYVAPTFATWARFAGGFGDSVASPGNATINTIKGFCAIAAGASSVVITNSNVGSGGKVAVKATLQTVDATLTQILAVVPNPAGGSFTVYGNANATAACQVYFEITE